MAAAALTDFRRKPNAFLTIQGDSVATLPSEF
jgi:hypothetical protein